jgi:hypothetical protein
LDPPPESRKHPAAGGGEISRKVCLQSARAPAILSPAGLASNLAGYDSQGGRALGEKK